MAEIRALGGGNVLMARSKAPLPRRTLLRAEEIYRARHGTPEGKVKATFQFVFMSGWGPDVSQQKPLRPGSARTRLADALKTEEISAGDKASFRARNRKNRTQALHAPGKPPAACKHLSKSGRLCFNGSSAGGMS